MDSFMDKIAQKFTAQDMIKANTAAEEKELERLRHQIAEYDMRIQEIRKLNLKNLELADHLQAMIDAENERMDAHADAQKAASGQEQKLKAELEAMAGVGRQQMEELSGKLAAQTKQLTLSKLETMERLDTLEDRMNMRPMLEQIEAKLQQRPTADEIAAKLDYRTAFEGIVSKLESRPTLDEIVERLGGDKQEGLEQKLTAFKEELSEHVHKENVKVYRNVEAAVANENKKLAEVIAASQKEWKEQLAKTEKKVTGLKVFSILTLIAVIVNIGIWVATALNLLPVF